MKEVALLFIPFMIGYLYRHWQSLSYDDALKKLNKIERGMASYNRLHHQWMRAVIEWRDRLLSVTGAIKAGSPEVAVERLHEMVDLMKEGAQLLAERPNLDQEVASNFS